MARSLTSDLKLVLGNRMTDKIIRKIYFEDRNSVPIVMCILLVFQYMFSVFTTGSVLVIRRTSFL